MSVVSSSNKNSGFSLIEVVFSIFLLSTGLVAAVQLVTSGIVESMDSRDQLIASELAQEGLELVRNIRDNNWANAGGSFDHITLGNNCFLDMEYAYPANIKCNNSSKKLYLNGSGFYVHSSVGATTTKFQRKLNITASGNDLKIVSMVSWNGAEPVSEASCSLVNKCVSENTIITKRGE